MSPFLFRVRGQPFLWELGVLLLEGLHATLEMHLQPFPAVNGEKLHPFRHIAPLYNSANGIITPH